MHASTNDRVEQPWDSLSRNSVRVPVTLSWQNVNYKVKVPTKKCGKGKVEKKILQDVSGIVKPGHLLAIIGSTGAGKSSLLDVLAQRKNKSDIKGSILFNGQRPNKYFKRLSAYVTQDDALPGLFTVRETLQFYADLKLPSVISKEERRKRVDELITELGLNKVADSRVGTQFVRGISGGEKKRLSVGCQLITDPGLLFLDEPTTGLDAFNSQGVMEVLNRLCERGRTIICTIHQPRSTIYELFDQLMILSQGKTVYFGPSGRAVEYFSRLGYTCGQFINPADYFIDITILNEDALLRAKTSEGSALLQHKVESEQNTNFAATFKNSEIDRQITEDISNSETQFANNPVKTSELNEYASSPFKQMMVLCKRFFLGLMRNPMVTYVQLGQTIFIAVLVGSIYFDIGLTQQSIQNRVGALFFVMTNQAFAMLASLNAFLEERDLFNRERASGCYRTSTYFLAKTLIEAPLLLFFPLLFGTVAYLMIGFQLTWACFLVFICTLVTFAAVAGSLFMLIGSISPNVVIAQILCPLVVVLFMLFGGFYVNVDTIPWYYIWVYYLSFFHYGYEILIFNEFHGWGEPNNQLEFVCNTNSTNCIYTGEQELAILGYADVDYDTIKIDFTIMWAMVIGYRILAYFALRFLHKEKR